MTKDDVESGHASTWRTVLKNAPVLKYQKAADGTVTDTIKPTMSICLRKKPFRVIP